MDRATGVAPSATFPAPGTVVAIEGQVGEKRPVGSQLVTLDVAGAGNVAEAAKIGRASCRERVFRTV